VPREDLASLFARATIVVVPSLASTGASGVIHRAIGHGRAVVVSDLPDFRALADEEGLRFEWFASGDVAALAGAIDALLGDPARRAATVAHNLRSVARLAPSHTVDAYLDLFIGHRRAAPAASRTIAPTLLEPRVEA
jgi:glycosyltransferase involved in cell wall biosynthesis